MIRYIVLSVAQLVELLVALCKVIGSIRGAYIFFCQWSLFFSILPHTS